MTDCQQRSSGTPRVTALALMALLALAPSCAAYPNKPSGIRYITPGLLLTPDGTNPPPNQLRITHLGTGTPDEYPTQVSTGILLELGNRDKFLFDFGGGAFTRLNSIGVPADQISSLFLSHYHSDHITDIPALIVARGPRATPLQIYGPSGHNSRFGVRSLVDGLRQFLAWDQLARATVTVNNRSAKYDATYNANVEANEFPFASKGYVVYDKNGIKVTSTPVHHYFTDGPVAFRVDWNGLSWVYSGDRNATQWGSGPDNFIQLAKGADVVAHEVVGPIDDSKFSELRPAWQNILVSHTSPRDAGTIFSQLNPRLAVIYHATVNDFTAPQLVSELRLTYPKGLVSLASDFTVYTVDKASINQSRWLYSEQPWGFTFTTLPSQSYFPAP